MTDKLKRLREWAQKFVEERKVRGDFMLARHVVEEIDRLLAEPEAAPTDAEVDAWRKMAYGPIPASDDGAWLDTLVDEAMRLMRRSKADDGLLAAAKAALGELPRSSSCSMCHDSTWDHECDSVPNAKREALERAIAAREAGRTTTHADIERQGAVNHDKGRTCGICQRDVPSGFKHEHGYGVCDKAREAGGAK